MKSPKVSLTFQSVDDIIWCDHSNETFFAVLLSDVLCFLVFHEMKCVNVVGFLPWPLLGAKWLKRKPMGLLCVCNPDVL